MIGRMDRKIIRTAAVMLLLFISLLSNDASLTVKGADHPFAGGSGTEVDPYLIATPEQLDSMRSNINAHYKLIADINLTGVNWKPIGTKDQEFAGSLDGNGYKIIGLTIHEPNEGSTYQYGAGLFGMSKSSAVFKNISLIDVDVLGRSNVGALVGWNRGEIINSFSSGRVEGFSNVGGLVGAHRDGLIDHSCSDAAVIGYGIGESHSFGFGGLVGEVMGGDMIYSCATGDVTTDGGYVGGLAGIYDVSFEGRERGIIRNSYATGNVTGKYVVGGLIGDSYAEVLFDSYAMGDVTGDENVGGLIGARHFTTVHNSYAVGKVTRLDPESPDQMNGGFIGYEPYYGRLHNSFYDMETTGWSEDWKGTPKTTAEMKDRNTFVNAGWDFDEVWEIDPLYNNGYPYLKNIQAFIKYDGNGHTEGTEPFDGMSYKPGDTVIAMDNVGGLARTGYSFIGWNSQADGQGIDYPVNQPFNAREVNVLYAKWLGNPYTVSFDAQGGVVSIAEQHKRYGAAYGKDLDGQSEALPIPIREGHTFLGWYTAPGGQGELVTNESAVGIMADHMLYADWALNVYDVIFETNGGSFVDKQDVTHGELAIEPATPVQIGHTFAGWFEDSGFTSAYNFASPVLSDIVLYAKWEVNQYTVTYDGNGHDNGNAPEAVTENYMWDVVVSDNVGVLTKIGHTFAGWNTAPDGSGESYLPGQTLILGAEDVTLYAQWSINQYTVSYDGNGSDSGDGPDAVTRDFATDVVISGHGELAKTGYSFSGWNTAEDGSGVGYQPGDVLTIGTDNVLLYAQWSINQYTVTYDGNGHDSGSVPGAVTENYLWDVMVSDNEGDLVKTGYTFVGWNTAPDGSGESYLPGQTLILGAEDVTLYAQWSINQYTVTYDGNGHDGGNVPDSVTENYLWDVVVSDNVGDLVKTGYTFVDWNTAPDGSGESYLPGQTLILGTEDVTLYAQWSINQYTVSYDGNGSDSGSTPDSVNQDYNTEVTVAGNTDNLAKTGYTFAGWNTAVDGSGVGYQPGDVLTIGTDNVLLYAQWSINQYTVTYDGNGHDSGSVPGAVTENYLWDVIVSDNEGDLAKIGYTFAGWNTAPDGTGESYLPGQTLILGAEDVTLYAQWSINQYTVIYDGNGHDSGSVPDTVTQDYGTDIVVSEQGTLSKIGYSFAGWNTAPDGTGESYLPGQTLTLGADDVMLYAQWSINRYTVTYDGNGHDSGSVPYTVTQDYGTDIIVSDQGTLSKIGYSFTGWNTAPDGSGESYLPGQTLILGAGDVTLYAKWTINQYTVSYDGNGSDSGSLPKAETKNYLWDVVVSDNEGDLTKTGHTFAGWNTAPDGSGESYQPGQTLILGAEDVTLYAQWTINQYTVSYDGNGNDSGSVPDTVTQDYGTDIVISDQGTLSKIGYSFAGWNTAIDGSGSAYHPGEKLMLGADDVMLYAQWSINQYTVSYDGNGNDSGSEPEPINNDYNTDVTVAGNTGNLTKTGYTFAGWNTAPDGSGESYLPGQTMILDAEDVMLYAQWSINQYTVFYDSNGSESGSSPEPVTQDYGTDIVVSDQETLSKIGYNFAGWNTQADGSGTEYQAGSELTLSAQDITLYAQWKIIISSPVMDSRDEQVVESPVESTEPPLAPEDDGGTGENVHQPEEVESEADQTTDVQLKVNFPDIESHWGEHAIATASERQLINGYPDGSFRPNDPITRAEFTVVLVKALQLGGSDTSLTFSDLDKIGKWAQPATAIAVEHGIINGYGDGSFRPNDHITRAEMAVMIAKALGVTINNDGSTGFADDEKIPRWAKGAVEAIRQMGIISGRGDNQFAASASATRAEAVVMLLRMLNNQYRE